MKIIMDDSRITSIAQLRKLLKGSQKLDLSLRNAAIDEKYAFIIKTVFRFRYTKLSRHEKRLVLSYLKKLTGYKRSQLSSLVARAIAGTLVRRKYKRVNPTRVYTVHDIKLLEETDEYHLRLSEKATKEIFRRECELFGNKDYQTIAKISHGHISNLRNSAVYKSNWINHTKARQVSIGITQKPQNNHKPGSIRIDSVHQRDVYHINSVDEITQWEVVFCVARITEECMRKALPLIFEQYPFTIFNFHSDRGSETINYLVADYLQRLSIKQTKSRSCHTNDNALVEGKNGSVVRKNMGWEPIGKDCVDSINDYYKNFFNPYLNYHRPCAYPTIITDDKGKRTKRYDTYTTPYEALKSAKNVKEYLKSGVTFAKLDTIAYSKSDNEFAKLLREEERKLFTEIRKRD
jgi:hypothetical protein